MKKLTRIIAPAFFLFSCQSMNENSSNGVTGTTIIYVQFDAETFKPISKENIADHYNCSFFVESDSETFIALLESFNDHASGGYFSNKVVRAKFINLLADEVYVDRDGLMFLDGSEKTFRLSASAFSNIKSILANLEISQSGNCRQNDLLTTIPKELR